MGKKLNLRFTLLISYLREAYLIRIPTLSDSGKIPTSSCARAGARMRAGAGARADACVCTLMREGGRVSRGKASGGAGGLAGERLEPSKRKANRSALG